MSRSSAPARSAQCAPLALSPLRSKPPAAPALRSELQPLPATWLPTSGAEVIRLNQLETYLLESAAKLALSAQVIPFSSLRGESTRAAQGLTRLGLLARRRTGYGLTAAGQKVLEYNP